VYYSTYGIGGHVDTIEPMTGRRRRRRHSAAFKAELVGACRRPGVSIAAVAMLHAVNANLLRRWVVEAEEQDGRARRSVKALASSGDAFIALPVAANVTADTPIRIEVRRGSLTVSVQWPSTGLHECAIWLREVLK
jgi:transposase